MLWLRAPLSPEVECSVEMTRPPSREEVLALIAYLNVYLARPTTEKIIVGSESPLYTVTPP